MEDPIKLQNFIGGQFVSASGTYIDSFNPATGEVLAQVPNSDAEIVNQAVAAAKAAFPQWSSKDIKERAKICEKIADIIEKRLDIFAEAECRDQGKPLWLAREIEIPRVMLNFRHFARTALCDDDKTIHDSNEDVINYTIHEPVGVAAIIVPWNLPIYLLTFKLAPALIYGNTVVVKPSEFTSVTAYMLCSVLKEAGIPDGVVNIVFGYGHIAGEALVNHADVSLISFTGSTRTGIHIAEIAAKNNKKISLEMGGKNAAVVFEDTNLLQCVPALIKASFLNQGQVCLSTSRIFIQDKIFKGFVEMFCNETKNLVIGDPLSKETFLGPLCSKQHFEKVKGYIQQARKDGMKFLVGEKENLVLPDDNKNGYYVQPVVLTDVPESSIYMQEEIFGPLTCLSSFKTEEEVIQSANNTKYGLCASVWSSDIKRIHRLAHKLEVGTVWCNSWLLRNLHMPFGGMKMSGMGREGTEDSRDFYTSKKSVCLRYA